MPRVTKIKPQKNSQKVNVYLDGKFAFGLPLEAAVKSGLKIGLELSFKEAKKLVFKKEFQKLLGRAYHFLSFRPRSEKEIKTFLKKKNATTQVSQKIIERLKKIGQLDDYKFAQWWIEQRSSFRPRGKLALRIELQQKGIPFEVALPLIDKMVDELSLAEKAAQKKLKAYKKLSFGEFRQKLAGFLSRRGFSWSTIKLVLEKIKKIKYNDKN